MPTVDRRLMILVSFIEIAPFSVFGADRGSTCKKSSLPGHIVVPLRLLMQILLSLFDDPASADWLSAACSVY